MMLMIMIDQRKRLKCDCNFITVIIVLNKLLGMCLGRLIYVVVTTRNGPISWEKLVPIRR